MKKPKKKVYKLRIKLVLCPEQQQELIAALFKK